MVTQCLTGLLASFIKNVLKPFMSKKIIIDIETIGRDFDFFDEASREYILKFAETEEDSKAAKEGLSLYSRNMIEKTPRYLI